MFAEEDWVALVKSGVLSGALSQALSNLHVFYMNFNKAIAEILVFWKPQVKPQTFIQLQNLP